MVTYGADDGVAWVGLTPFVRADARPAGVPATVPGLPSFAETNLRPYSLGALRVATQGDTVSYACSRGAGRVPYRLYVRWAVSGRRP
ncbi:DUF2071 domain-containing protein [Streptomyces canus]|uniref:DUF2071 domain-containing protein n=1 Tax=Streptomyces canus TaxID=58343 RepID=UPI0033BD87F0